MAYEVFTQRFVPTTGQTITLANSPAPLLQFVADPAGTLAALTVVFPDKAFDGQRVSMATTKAITALTLNGGVPGSTFSQVVTTAAANAFIEYFYEVTQNKWYRIG